MEKNLSFVNNNCVDRGVVKPIKTDAVLTGFT